MAIITLPFLVDDACCLMERRDFTKRVCLSQVTSSVSHTAHIPLDVCTALHRPCAHIQAFSKFASLTTTAVAWERDRVAPPYYTHRLHEGIDDMVPGLAAQPRTCNLGLHSVQIGDSIRTDCMPLFQIRPQNVFLSRVPFYFPLPLVIISSSTFLSCAGPPLYESVLAE